MLDASPVHGINNEHVVSHEPGLPQAALPLLDFAIATTGLKTGAPKHVDYRKNVLRVPIEKNKIKTMAPQPAVKECLYIKKSHEH